MNLPNIPTDNYYKFKSIGYLSILIVTLFFGGTYYFNRLDFISQTENDLIRIKLKKEIGEIKKRQIEEYSEKIKRENLNYSKLGLSEQTKIDFFIKNSSKMELDANYRDYLEFLYRNEDRLFNLGSYYKKIEQLEMELDSIDVEQQIFIKELSLFSDLQFKRNKGDWFYHILYIIVVALLLISVKRSFNEWKTKVQDKIDEKFALEIELMRKKASERSVTNN